MIDFGLISAEIPAHFTVPNMLLLAGAKQNVGKTTFATASIRHLKLLGYKVFGLKITPHFHEQKPEFILFENEDFLIALEKNKDGKKDSSRMLIAGADEVFFIQTKTDKALLAAFNYVIRLAPENVLWVCESGGLRTNVTPGLFLYFKLKGENPSKDSAKTLMPLADKIVNFDGINFDFLPEDLKIRANGFYLD
jgi:hypothetical protein